ncbi:MAG TPA: hypothetical protein VFM47_05925 [Gaiellales bacterium]|nr:hypothetical protein [Gaiellales bacterium]
MSVAFELIDAPYPYVCAVYRCDCGATAMRHGDEAAVPPADWQVHRSADDEPQAVCPHCAARAAEPPA